MSFYKNHYICETKLFYNAKKNIPHFLLHISSRIHPDIRDTFLPIFEPFLFYKQRKIFGFASSSYNYLHHSNSLFFPTKTYGENQFNDGAGIIRTKISFGHSMFSIDSSSQKKH